MKRDAVHPQSPSMRADPPADDAVAHMLAGADGYRLVMRFLVDQTRPLRLPDALLGRAGDTPERTSA